jgi:ribosomal protein S18 acetylase RimI-like enzyme
MIEIEAVTQVSDELVQAFERLVPQLTAFSTPPTRVELEEIVSSRASQLLAARAEPGGPILGVLTLVIFRTPTGLHAWIEDVVVEEGQRRQGIGAALAQAGLERAAHLGAKTVKLTSRPARESANRLYQRLGFIQRDTNLYEYKFSEPKSEG